MIKEKIKIVDNYILEDDAKYFINSMDLNNLSSENSTNFGAKDFKNDIDAFNLLKKYSKNIKNAIKDFYIINKDLYIFKTMGFKWQDGWSQHPHIDAQGPGKSIEWSAVIYLNDNYDGGEIEFPNKSLIYKPKKYSAVFFPGNDEEYLHQVNTIKNNSRYTLLFLFTANIDDANKDFLE